MNRLLTAIVLLLIPGLAVSAEIYVGGAKLEIPSPAGFSPVTPQMSGLYELQKQFVGPMNQEFVAFIPTPDTKTALAGNIPSLPRRFSVQTLAKIANSNITKADFTTVRNTLKSQQAELLKTFEKTAPGLASRINEGMRDKYDVDVALSISGIVPLGIHEETDRTLSFSALVKYGVKDADGNPASFTSVSTTTIAHVNGRILFLYCFAEEAGLDWSRSASKQWAGAVLRANPAELRLSMSNAAPLLLAGFDWTAVLGAAVGGALIAGVATLIRQLVNRNQNDR